MAIVSGVNIPDNKRVEISLRSIFGIGAFQARDIVDKAGIIGNPRVNELVESDLTRIREIVDREKMVEGDLRRDFPDAFGEGAIAVKPVYYGAEIYAENIAFAEHSTTWNSVHYLLVYRRANCAGERYSATRLIALE